MKPFSHAIFHLLPIGLALVSTSIAEPMQSGVQLSLKVALQKAVENNPDLAAMHKNIAASQGRFLSAISPMPTDLSITHDDIPKSAALSSFGVKTIEISQTFDFPSTYFLRGARYSKENKIAQSEYESAKIAVLARVKKAYFNALALQEQVKLAEQNCTIMQDFMAKAEVRHKVGESANLEKLTAKVNYTEALNNIEIKKNQLIAAHTALNCAIGSERIETLSYIFTDTLSAVPCAFTLVKIQEEASLTNPNLKISRMRVDACALDKALAWSSMLPNFTIGYFTKQPKNDPNDVYGVSTSIGIPIWFLLDNNGKIQEASALASGARLQLRSQTNAVYSRSQIAFTEYKQQEKQVQLYTNDILPQAEEIFKSAIKSYEAGEISYIEYLQAQQTHINSKNGYIEALVSYNLSIVAIEEEIGQLIQ